MMFELVAEMADLDLKVPWGKVNSKSFPQSRILG